MEPPASAAVVVQVERAELSRKQFQYLYEQGGRLHLMDPATYEMLEASADVAGPMRGLLKEGETIVLELYEEEPLGMLIPQSVDVEVVGINEGNLGERKAILANGVTISAPRYIEKGNLISVRTADWSYVGKA